MRSPPALVGALLASAFALAAPITADAATPADGEVAERRAELARRAGRPDAIVPLLGALDLWRDVDDRGALLALLDEGARDPRQLADVRARATWLRSLAADHLADRERAEALRASLGFVREWLVIGPFDNEGRAGFARRDPPESDLVGPIDPTRAVQGKERLVSYRALPERVVRAGLVPLEAALRPTESVVAYATTWIEVPRATAAAVRVGSSGAIAVWVDGRLALSRDVYRPARFDQDAAGVRLHAGWNRVTVKLASAEGGLAFLLRVTTPDGRPLAFRVSASSPSTPAAARSATATRGARPGPAAPRVSDLGAALAAAARRAPGDAEAHRALGLYLRDVAPDDPEVHRARAELARAAELAPSTRAFRELARAATDGNQRKRALERGLERPLAASASPVERAGALVELSEAYQRSHRDRRAGELLREALAVSRESVPARIALAELVADEGLPSRGAELLSPLLGGHAALAVLRAAALLDERRGHRADAERRTVALAAALADDAEVLRQLVSFARARGDVTDALLRLDQLARARPDLVSPALDRADLLDGVGRSDEAHATLARAIDLCPDEPRLLERDGRVLHRLGKDEEALARLHRALELRPQNPDLRAYAREIDAHRRAATATATGAKPSGAGSSGDDLARAFSVPLDELVARARKRPAPPTGDPARVLLDLAVTRVHPNGLSETFTQRAVEILDERGAREQGDVDIRYTPDTQSVEVRSARVRKRSGEVVEASAETDRDLSEPWYGLYYDVHAQVIDLPHLEPGDIVDVEYVVSDVGRRNLFSDYFGELHMLEEDLVRLESTYVLVTPRARAFYFNHPRLPDGKRLEVAEQVRGDERVYTVRARDVPKIEAEPGMPGFTDVAAYVHVSTYRSWEEVAAWYRGLVAEQLVADDEIRRAVAAALAGAPPGDERARIRRLYDLVVQKTRYVGLEFGIHGFKPYRVSQVFSRKFGDCKDKASLLVVMLREAGIDATMVLARTRRGGDLEAFPASLAPFDHAIVYVPKYDLYLDGTAEFSGSDELPAQDQDIPVLLVSDSRNGGKGRLARTPVDAPDRNRVERELRVALTPTGSARVRLESVVSGEVAHEWRAHYQSPGERAERFEKAENASHPGARVLEVEFPTLDDLERPVEVRAELDVPSWARARGSDLEMPALGRPGELLRSYARLSSRRYDLVLGFPWEQRERVTIALPPGYAPRRLPEARRIDAPFGHFALTVDHAGPEVVVTSALEVSRHRIAPADYPEFRKFCLAVDAALSQELVLAHE